MNEAIFMVLVGSLVVTACTGFLPGWRGVSTEPVGPGTGWWGGISFASNGERIYFTATNDRGERIPYSGGPSFGGGMMMGSYLTCAACHGVDGRGGSHTMHMQVMDAPDIRYAALNSEGEDHGKQDHAEGGTGYSLEDFRRAVTLGEHPDGEPLDSDMPRWRMSEEDLADLFEFIKTLP